MDGNKDSSPETSPHRLLCYPDRRSEISEDTYLKDEKAIPPNGPHLTPGSSSKDNTSVGQQCFGHQQSSMH